MAGRGRRHFEDFVVGRVVEGATGRTVTDYDIVAFDGLSGDFSPLHVDHEYMKGNTSTGGVPMANGFLGLALQAGLVEKLDGGVPPAGAGLIRSLEWSFRAPVLRGDTLRVRSIVEQCTEVDKRTGLVRFRRELINQSGAVVQQGVVEQEVDRAE